jgi:hypothetical protein
VELWRKLRHAWDLTAVAELLEGRGRKNRPSFGLVAQSEACVVVALGGRAVAELTIRDSVERVECPGFVTSIEYRFASSPTSVRVFSQADAPPGARLPLSGGVVRAAEIVLEWEVTPDGERLAAPSSIQRMDDSKPPVPESAVGAEHLATEVAGAAATLPAVSLPQFRSGGLDDGTVHAATEADVPLPGEFAGREGTYDHLFGHTVQRTVEGAAVRSSDAEARSVVPEATVPPSVSPAPGSIPVVVAPHESITPARSTPSSTSPSPGSGMIDAIPWTRTESGSTKTPSPPPAEAELVELTISREAQAALLRRMSAPGSLVIAGPTVHAVRCPAHHANPAHADVCRVCGALIPDQSPVTVPRPVLGVLRMSTGDLVTLDRGVVLGRSPDADRLVHGERPHVVKLPSPGQDISRTHLEVSLEDWHVLVTDLNSTNGTLITRPGQEPERLRPDQPTMIEPGTVVSLADELSFTFEATA